MARYQSYIPRSVRRREKKTQKKLVWNVIIGLILIYVIFFWGIPALIGNLSNLHKSSVAIQKGADITLAPPVLNIPYEATSSASIQIDGYSAPNNKVEIYLDDDLVSTIQSDSDGSFKSSSIDLKLGTNNIYGKTVDDKGTKSLPSKTIQITYNNQKPKLDISSPDENSQIKGGDKKVTVSGSTDPNDNISVNGTTVIVNGDGSFSTQVGINDGANTFTIVATDSIGNTTTVTRHVNYSAS